MTALILDPHPYAHLGPFYTTSSLTTWLGISREAIDQKVRARQLLGCPTADDAQRVYPVWQFQADGDAIPHLREVLDVLRMGIDDPWTWAAWLAAEVPGRLGGQPAYRVLAEDGGEAVLDEARRSVARLAH